MHLRVVCWYLFFSLLLKIIACTLSTLVLEWNSWILMHSLNKYFKLFSIFLQTYGFGRGFACWAIIDLRETIIHFHSLKIFENHWAWHGRKMQLAIFCISSAHSKVNCQEFRLLIALFLLLFWQLTRPIVNCLIFILYDIISLQFVFIASERLQLQRLWIINWSRTHMYIDCYPTIWQH